MKLLELDPRWFTIAEEEGASVGMTFLCPHCRTCYLGVWFRDPVNLERVRGLHPDWDTYMAEHPERSYWQRDGADFATMTITPSIDASKAGHWHGFIRNGEVT